MLSLRVFVHKVWLYSLDKMIMYGPEAGNVANMYMTIIQSMCMRPVYISLKLGMDLAYEGTRGSLAEIKTKAFLVA